MRKTLLLTAAATVLFAGSALADEYYVIQKPDTKTCEVITTKPTEKETITQIGSVTFKTKTEAEDRMKQIKVCHDSSDSN